MRLDAEEEAMLAGELGEPRRFALAQQLAVGRFFDAPDFVPVSQAHLMADGEAVGAAGTALLERLAAAPPGDRRVRVPTITDPRGVDPKACAWLRQPKHAPERERRIVDALRAMGVLLTNTCINYQIVAPPVRGEHVAFGDTGSTIYANGVLGARSNFEGGVAALWAALTGRVPRYGFHLDRVRRGTRAFRVETQPVDYADWGALGAVIGKRMGSYWDVPVLTGIETSPGSDELKHFGAALASWGSTPMFHIVGVTPEAADEKAAFGGTLTCRGRAHRRGGHSWLLQWLRTRRCVGGCGRFRRTAALASGNRAAGGAARRQADRGLDRPPRGRAAGGGVRSRAPGPKATIEAAGGRLLEGVCFYQMYAREMGQAMGWRRLVTNSAKLANIIQGYGYTPVLQPTAACVEAAVRGKLA